MSMVIMDGHHRGKFDALRSCLESISSVTQDLTKVFIYVTILIVLSSVLFQYLRFLYLKGPAVDLPSYYGEYDVLVQSVKRVGERFHEIEESSSTDAIAEKRFGQLLPEEDLSVDEMPPHDAYKMRARKLSQTAARSVRYEEASMSIKKAKQLAKAGNKKLASKLFQHALALEPEFADALTVYGEFLEDDNNIVQADLLYQRALSYEPSHTTALANRERTMPLVEEHDKNMLTEIDRKKSELYKYPANNNALRKAMKEFYYQHIYHTVALEGNTLSLGEIREIINSRNGIAGKSIFEHNEVIGVDEALKYLNNTLLLSIGSITVGQIREIHKRVIGFVDPVNAGVFRSNQVYVGKHIPPHPNDVPKYMEDFNDWLNSDEARRLHPVEFAALAHYKLVYVHPFIDGNGRTSRLLMNLILMKHGFPPVSIQVNDRWEYYEALEAGNEGDIRPFIRFIARCVSFTLDDYLFAAEDLGYRYPELSGTNHVIQVGDES